MSKLTEALELAIKAVYRVKISVAIVMAMTEEEDWESGEMVEVEDGEKFVISALAVRELV